MQFVRVRPAKRDLLPYAGTYVSGELPARWTLQVVDDVLTVIRPTGGAIRLNPVFEDGFRGSALGTIGLFIRDQKGEIVGMEAMDLRRNGGDPVCRQAPSSIFECHSLDSSLS